MKKYKVKVNGTMYEVEVEEVESTDASITSTKTKETTSPASNTTEHKVESLMQGLITEIKVHVGEQVKKGQTLAILETMKMENDIVSPVDGTISHIYVSKQDTVENQEVIMTIK